MAHYFVTRTLNDNGKQTELHKMLFATYKDAYGWIKEMRCYAQASSLKYENIGRKGIIIYNKHGYCKHQIVAA